MIIIFVPYDNTNYKVNAYASKVSFKATPELLKALEKENSIVWEK